MAKPDKKPVKSKSSKATTKSEATASVVANVRLVAALKAYDTSLAQTQSYLVELGTIAQEEQLTRAEVVASLMEARGIEKSTAESQYSRMKAIITDPEALESLRSGEADLKTVREKTKKGQKNPSKDVAKKNAEKKFATAITTLVNASKELGLDRDSVIVTVKSALKKAGVI